jgi:hypothetical protein
MPSTVGWVREGGIVEFVYIHEGSLKEVGRYLLANVDQSNISKLMLIGDRVEITDDTGDLDESELCKSLNHLLLLDGINTDYIFIYNRIGFWEVATRSDKTFHNLETILMQSSQENEFTTKQTEVEMIDIELLKAEIIDELMEVLPEVILDKFDERMYTIFGIKPPTKH